MTEEELLQLLEVTQERWSLFYLASHRTMCKAGGLINITCQVMAKAVRQRYLATRSSRIQVHQKLMNFFQRASPDLVGELRAFSRPHRRASAPIEWEFDKSRDAAPHLPY